MRTYKAYNLATGKTIETSTRKELRKAVRRATRFTAIAYGRRSYWVFSPKNIPTDGWISFYKNFKNF